jgi:hypothetical protein
MEADDLISGGEGTPIYIISQRGGGEIETAELMKTGERF